MEGTLRLGQFRYGQDGNLDTLQHADDGQETDEKEDGHTDGDAVPHGGLAEQESL